MVIEVGKIAREFAESKGGDGCFDVRAVYIVLLKSAKECFEQDNLTEPLKFPSFSLEETFEG